MLSASLLYGAITGLAFALTFWGYDTILLTRANVAYAWLPFIIGVTCSVLIYALVACLTYLANSSLVGFVIWAMAARLIAELTIAIPIKIAPRIMEILEAGVGVWVPYHTYNVAFKTWIGIGFIWLAIFSGILGLLQLTLLEQATHSFTPFSRVMPFIISIAVMLLGSLMVNNLVNERLHSPLLAVNDLIEFAIENKGATVEPALARQRHLGAVGGISDVVVPPFRLFLGNYDDTFDQVDVLVDFDGEWVLCITMNSTPSYCKLAKEQ